MYVTGSVLRKVHSLLVVVVVAALAAAAAATATTTISINVVLNTFPGIVALSVTKSGRQRRLTVVGTNQLFLHN